MNKKWVYSILSGLVFLNLAAYSVVFDLARPMFLEINFFDVGQGDSIFIETQGSNQILIDGGPDSGVLKNLNKEMPFYDRTIDLMILTHADKDHLFGLLDVLKRYEVKNIVWTGAKNESALCNEWIKLIEEEEAKIVIARQGERIVVNEIPLVYMDIIHPDSIENYSNLNDTSVITRLVFEKTSILMMGDATKRTDKNILKWDLKSDVLKVAHHGSKDSTSSELLKKTSPKAAVISVGKNNYGHPSQEVLESLGNSGIEVLRTDEYGDIKMLSDGEEIKVYKK
jgi:competence protein ComEC